MQIIKYGAEKVLLLITISTFCTTTLSSCAVVKSESFTSNGLEAKAPKHQAGIVYFLPMKRLKLSGEINKIPSRLQRAKTALADANTSASAAKQTLDTAKATRVRAKSAADAASSASPPLSADQLAVLQRTLSNAVAAEFAANTLYKRAEAVAETKLNEYNAIRDSAQNISTTPKIDLSVELLSAEPDPDAAFYARPWHSWLRDDNIKINVNNRGLLTSSNVTADDKTDEILVELAGAVGAFFNPLGTVDAFSSTGGTGDREGFCEANVPLKFEFIFDPIEWLIADQYDENQAGLASNAPTVYIDPAVGKEILRYKKLLNCYGHRLVVERLGREGDNKLSDDFRDHDPSPNRAAIKASRPYGAEPPRAGDAHWLEDGNRVSYLGYAYRPQLPYRVSIQRRLGDSAKETDATDVTKDRADRLQEDIDRLRADLAKIRTSADGIQSTLSDHVKSSQAHLDQPNAKDADSAEKPPALNATFERLNAEPLSDQSWISVQSSIVMLPNEGPTAYIPIRSAAFVKTVNDVQFEDGVVKSWTTDRPSEALELVRLPVEILTALVSVPAELIKLRVDVSSQEASLAQGQIAQIEAQERLTKLQNCLEIAAGSDDIEPLTCFPGDDAE